VLAVMVLAGCATGFLARAEQAEMTATLTLDRFVALERDHEVAMEAAIPGVHAFAEKVRREAPDALLALDNALGVYRATGGGQTDVQDLTAKLQALADQAQEWLNRWAAAQGGAR
jgi:hypothetical protein